MTGKAIPFSPLLRFANGIQVDVKTECWVWTKARTLGYGRFSVGRRHNVRVHRWSYEYFVGTIPEGLVLDHLCKNRACANPNHLEAVTFHENWRRGETPSSRFARATHCKNGHRFDDGVNTIHRKTKYGIARMCRICKLKLDADRRMRIKLERPKGE